MTKCPLLRSTIILLTIYLVLKGCWIVFPRIFQTLELQTQDAMLRLSWELGLARNISPYIVYVDIDDAAIAELPYRLNNPQLYAELITAIDRAGAASQIIDILLVSEKETANLNRAINTAGNVYLPVIFTRVSQKATPARRFPGSIAVGSASPISFPRGEPVVPADTIGIHSAEAVGHINSAPDIDGVYRRLPLFFRNGDQLIPTISLQVAIDFLQIQRDQLHFTPHYLAAGKVTLPDGRQRNMKIPYNTSGQTRINFVGPWPSIFAHYSAAAILEKSRDPLGRQQLLDELEGSLVILADVTTSGRDFGPVPFASHSPLSEMHAQMLNTILTDTFLRETSPAVNLLVEMLIIVLLVALARSFQGILLFSLILFCGVLLSGGSFFLLTLAQFCLPLVLPLSILVFSTLSIFLLQYIAIQQEKNILEARLSPYFAPTVKAKILAAPELLSTVSKKKLTILFSDIVGFTEWSTTREANEIHATLSRYFREMSAIVFEFEGTIDKFMGDGMLAFFGDPVDCPDHAQRAVQSALAMQQKALELKKEWSLTDGMKIRLRIGIHTGEVAVGNMGSLERLDYTVIGSHVNLAQRLESNCAPGRILISREVYRQLGESFKTTPHGAIQAKGFSEPVEAYYVDQYSLPGS